MPNRTRKPNDDGRHRATTTVEPAIRSDAQEVRMPTPEEISVRAYYLWEASVDRDGDPERYWLQAERELREL